MPAPPTSFAEPLRQADEANARTLREVAERL